MSKSERIVAAVEAHNKDPELSLTKLSKMYKINRQTLTNHIAEKNSTAIDYGVTKQRLTPAEEAILAETIQLAYQQAFPLTIASVREMANEILQGKGCNDPIGVNWHLSFLKRHPELRSAVSRPMDKQRVLSEDPDVFIHFFRLFEQTRAKYGISDGDTYNMDESGCAIGVEQASKIIIPADEKETFAKQDGKRQWATLIECVGADGDKAPLFAILAGKTHLIDYWSNVRSSKACLAVTDNGWTNNDIGLEWLKHFDAWSSPKTSGVYRLLLLDGHSSHLTLRFLRFAASHQIILLCLPPHATHRLQPLDVGIFGPMGMAYDGLLKRFSRYNGRGVTQREYIDWIQQAREKACTKANISSAFTATGLIPFNPNRVLGQLKVKKDYDRPITPPDYPQQAPPQLITTPDQIQQGTITLQIAGKDAEALIDQITKATPSQANHVATLKAVIQFHRAKNAVLSQQVQSFQSARANDKPRKKTKVKGSAKVYTKEEVDAIQAAIKEKQRLKNIQLAENAVRKSQAANKKAEKEALQQRQQEKRVQSAAEKAGIDAADRDGIDAVAARSTRARPIRRTKKAAALATAAMEVNCELNVEEDVFQ